MEIKKLSTTTSFLFVILLLFTLVACNNTDQKIGKKVVVAAPAEIAPSSADIIEASLEDAVDNDGKLLDFQLRYPAIVQALYAEKDYALKWSSEGKWLPKADSLFYFIGDLKKYGLFPQDYFYDQLKTVRNKTVFDTSSQNRLDASLWAQTDILLSAGLVQLVKDLKIGRLLPDSLLAKDTSINIDFYRQQFANFNTQTTVDFAARLEPSHHAYQNLKAALQTFLEEADLRPYTLVTTKDTVKMKKELWQRLAEEDTAIVVANDIDSAEFVNAIKRFQKRKGIKQDGKISYGLVSSLNDTDNDKFIRLAITLDRYKQMKPLPGQYIWVNIPSYRLKVWEDSAYVLTSKIVVGKSYTRTPELTSAISDMITYPLWTIPNSIIVKDILPNLKKNPGYLARKGYSLVDWKGNEIDPYQVNWDQYKTSIPYRVIQGSGDDNALGVLKFNFPNKHSVYLHDTNQRYLFSRDKRALSHGCVRVQNWQQLAHYILRQDSVVNEKSVPVDSLQTWLSLKEKHVIPLRKRIPLFIRYFTCEAEDGKLLFYEDIYGEDKKLRETYFATK